MVKVGSMEERIHNLEIIANLLTIHAPKLIMGIFILILGVLLAKWITKSLKKILTRLIQNTVTVSIASTAVGIFLYTLVVMLCAVEMGAKPEHVIVVVIMFNIIVIGIMIIFRPLLPKLPFKVGNMVKAGSLLGRIEAITLINTQLKTFDGKTFFVPNRKILNEVIINYHFTESRLIKIDLQIQYDQDLLKAKQVLEKLMIEDPRISTKPSPNVRVITLAPDGVKIGARCWVDNKNYWMAKCDLNEKVKLQFDLEGIKLAFPQLDVHLSCKNCSAPGGLSDGKKIVCSARQS
jgi:small conductance mechanosensitive channel